MSRRKDGKPREYDKNGPRRKRVEWQDDWYLLVYELAREGLENHSICQYLKMHNTTWKKFLERRPAILEALQKGRRERKEKIDSGKTFVLGMLSPRLQKLWARIEAAGEHNDFQTMKDLQRLTVISRQQLFLHALLSSCFSITDAAKKVNVPVPYITQWLNSDSNFKELYDGIIQAKKDMFESALVRKVQEGDTSAVLFVNRTINRDRGYNDKVDINIQKEVTHRHQVSVDELPLEMRRQMLELIRMKQTPQLTDRSDVIDVEATQVQDG